MIRAAQKDAELILDIVAARNQRDALHFWWLGQSGFLALHDGVTVLFDPYLSDSLTKKYAGTDTPHVRMTERVINPGQIPQVNMVTSSHNHTDHLDAATLIPILENNPQVSLIIPEANRDFVVERLGIHPGLPTGLNDGEAVTGKGADIFGITAAHEEMSRDEKGRSHYLGYVVRIGPWTVYHSGDTVLHYGLVDQLTRFEIDVAFLPINGRIPNSKIAGNLDGGEAARLAKEIGAKLAVPCHYGMFEHNTATTDLFEETCAAIDQEYEIPEHGERVTME